MLKVKRATWKEYALGFGLIMFLLGFSAGFTAAIVFLVLGAANV